MDIFTGSPPPEFFKTGYPLASLTRLRTGGTARFFAKVNNLEDLEETLSFSKQNGLFFYILGNGSNVLTDDNDFNGIVIILGNGFNFISFDYNENKITAGAGTSLMKLGARIAAHGHSGYTYMGVIPGTVGGAVAMNAGINDTEKIHNHFSSALVLNPETLKAEKYSLKKMDFSYRKSAVKNSDKIIIKCSFILPDKKNVSRNEAKEKLKQLLDLRREKQPKSSLTLGSTFKNPSDSIHSAGWLLEKTGMKKLKAGGAMVSNEHANWIINLGNATSNDVKALIDTGQKRVFEEFGISLEREIIYLPEDRL